MLSVCGLTAREPPISIQSSTRFSRFLAANTFFADLAQAPKALRSVPNASLFQVGDEDGKSMRVLHLYGSPYDMGVAQGAIFRDEIPKMVAGFFEYLDSEIEPYIKWLPQVTSFAFDCSLTAHHSVAGCSADHLDQGPSCCSSV